MKKTALLLAWFICLTASAQETASLEEAQKAAKLLAKSAGPINDAPFKVQVDLEKPNALKTGSVGILVIPDLQLKSELLAQATTNYLPVGQLWMLAVSPAPDGAPVPNPKLRLVSIQQDGKEARLQVFLLAVRKAAKDGLELVVFGRESTPLMSLPLKKTDAKQTLPVELAGKKNDENSGTLTINLFGKYETQMPVMKEAD